MKRSISRIAMAAALSLGTVGMMSVATPAVAAKKSAGKFSKEFVAAYQPLAEKVDAAQDGAALKAEVPALVALISSADEQLAGGQLIYNIGAKANDQTIQYQGIKLMLESGKIEAENQGKLYLAAGQLGYNAKDYANARTYLTRAQELMPNDPQIPALVAETYVQEGNFTQALSLINTAIDARKAAGQPASDAEAFRGLAIAANNGLNDQAAAWAVRVLESNPRPEYRAEALKVFSALAKYTPDEELDLLRLMYRSDALIDRRQYMAYLQSADARRRPGEVKALVEKGLAAGLLKSSDTIANDELKLATQNYSKVLGELDTDAKKSLPGNEMQAIADVYLGYGKSAQAETAYRAALSSGVTNKDQLLTGLGIALADQGKFDEAKTTFGQITSANRSQLARLWIAYANDKAS